MSAVPEDTISSILSKANQASADLLAERPPPIREVPEQQADWHSALKACLHGSSSGLTARETQLSVGKALAEKFPGLGGVDLTIERDGAPEALIELKLGKDKLWNCAWDLTKLALALRAGIAPRAFMVGAAPISSWKRERQGPDLFRRGRWATEAFMAQYRNCFRLWATSPARLPSELEVREVHTVSFQSGDEDYEMRVVEVIDDSAGWVGIDDDLVGRVQPTGSPPIRVAPEDSAEAANEGNCLLAFEGGSVHLLNDADLLINEAAAQSVVPDEGLDAVKLLRFATSADREEYVRDRGWLALDPTRNGGPAALHVEVRGQTRDVAIDLSGPKVVLREHGEFVAAGSPASKEWVEFFVEMDELDPWSWGRWYMPEAPMTDGELWSITIAHRGRLVRSRGHTVYPPGGDGDATSLNNLLSSFLRLVKDTSHL